MGDAMADGGGTINVKQGATSQRKDEAERKAAHSKALFHYTTGDGLIGIIRTGTLFASHFEFSNDSSECIELEKVLVPLFKSELEEIVPQLVKARAFHENYLKEYGNSVYGLEAGNIFRVFLKAVRNIAPFFIASFCQHDAGSPEYEHGLLSQWRGYGRGGFAIEFDEDSLDKLLATEHASHMYTGYSTNSVDYDNHEKRANLDQFRGAAGSMMAALVREASGHRMSPVSQEVGRQRSS